jgi:hypothetical protein
LVRPEEAWEAASDLSSQHHIIWVDRPFRRVSSVMPKLYDDIWTGAKGMYKLEPAIEDGGEVIIYAPHIDEISYTHRPHHRRRLGTTLATTFIKQWDTLQGLSARGDCAQHAPQGDRHVTTRTTGIEYPRIQRHAGDARSHASAASRSTLAISIRIRSASMSGRIVRTEGILLVPKAGEMLYRIKPDQS